MKKARKKDRKKYTALFLTIFHLLWHALVLFTLKVGDGLLFDVHQRQPKSGRRYQEADIHILLFFYCNEKVQGFRHGKKKTEIRGEGKESPILRYHLMLTFNEDKL